jgi:uncharacterized membrane protein YtjA (UPF0391 family)
LPFLLRETDARAEKLESAVCNTIHFLGGGEMLRWSLGFLIVALVAAIFGFAGLAIAAAGIAKILFYLFVILFLASLLGHIVRLT